MIFDELKVKKSLKQIFIYLKTKGYYDALVTDSVAFNEKKRRAIVFYEIKTGKVYSIRNITDSITDSEIARIISKDKSNTLLKSGNPFDLDVLQSERNRIADTLKNRGYYYFQKEYIFETLPVGSRWSDYGFDRVIVTTEATKKYVQELFPEVLVHIIPPIIGDNFKPTEGIIKPFIAISCRDRKSTRLNSSH